MLDHNCLDNLMSVEEASKKWNLSTAKVKQLCWAGRVKATKLGSEERGTWVILKDQPSPNKNM